MIGNLSNLNIGYIKSADFTAKELIIIVTKYKFLLEKIKKIILKKEFV